MLNGEFQSLVLDHMHICRVPIDNKEVVSVRGRSLTQPSLLLRAVCGHR